MSSGDSSSSQAKNEDDSSSIRSNSSNSDQIIATEIKTDKNDSDDYDESFESESSSTSSNKYTPKPDSSSKTTKSNKYSESFESNVTSSSSLTKSQYSKLNYSKFIRGLKHKLKLEKTKDEEEKTVKYSNHQIRKLISIVNKSKSRSLESFESEEKGKSSYTKVELNEERLNRLRAANNVKKICDKQMEKVAIFGNELTQDGEIVEDIYAKEYTTKEEDIYFRLKCERVKSNATNMNFIEHEINYCDSIMMIADLARNLPRHTENPEVIWEQLMKNSFFNDIK